MAGGTDLLVQMYQQTQVTTVVVGLRNVAELKGIRYDDATGLQIGAGVALHAIAEDSLIKKKYPAVAEAAGAVGALQHQFMGTLGGNICLDTRCWYYNQSAGWRRSQTPCHKLGGTTCHAVKGAKKCFAVYAGDTASVLIALGGQVALADQRGHEKVVGLEEIFSGNPAKPFTLGPGSIITKIILPPSEPTVSRYYKLRPRGSIDFAQVGVAIAYYQDRKIFRIVANAVEGQPIRLENVEELLSREKMREDIMPHVVKLVTARVKPVENVFGTASYRKHMAGVLVKRGLREVAAS
jgi:4-hydroxybenzoyl-CoA reductase subunit beta